MLLLVMRIPLRKILTMNQLLQTTKLPIILRLTELLNQKTKLKTSAENSDVPKDMVAENVSLSNFLTKIILMLCLKRKKSMDVRMPVVLQIASLINQ